MSEPEPFVSAWPCGCLRAAAVLALAQDLTYRQLNRWTASGLLPANRHDPRTSEHLPWDAYGTGVPMGWQPDVAARAAAAARLIVAVTPSAHLRPTNGLPPEIALALVDRGLLVDLDGVPHMLALVPLPVDVLDVLEVP